MRKVAHLLLFSFMVVSLGIVLSGSSCDEDDGLDAADSGAIDDPNADGPTWTDPATNLTWQVDLGEQVDGLGMTLADGKSYCENLVLKGGGWRLPSISELRTLIRGCDETATGGACGVTDECLDYVCENVDWSSWDEVLEAPVSPCWTCEQDDGPNDGCYGAAELPLPCWNYWSSSPVEGSADWAWAVSFGWAFIVPEDGEYRLAVRCVK